MADTLTIIIPVYKAAQTLDECVRSVLRSCGTDSQVVLVDDGSPDECPRLCDEWALRDKRVEVLHRHNGGLSAARNSALAIARGEWVTFVDSDDVIDVDFGGLLSSLDDNVDFVEYPICRHFRSNNEILMRWGEHTYTSAIEYWLRNEVWKHSYASNKIIRTRLFDDVRFPEGRVFEDIWTIPLLLKKARRIQTVTKGMYGYQDNKNGITATANGAELSDLLQGNINAVRVLGVCDVRHYAEMLNIQMDVYRLTRRIMLGRRHFKYTEIMSLPLGSCIKTLMPIRLLCRLHSVLKSF